MSGLDLRKSLSSRIEQKVQQEKQRIEDQLKTLKPADPEYLLWENIGCTNFSRSVRRKISILVCFFVVYLTTLSMNYMNSIKEDFEGKDTSHVNCNLEVTQSMAQADILREPAEQRGHMPCFCFTQLKTNYISFFDLKFEDGEDHCHRWFREYTIG